jgi:hypothetical protein
MSLPALPFATLFSQKEVNRANATVAASPEVSFITPIVDFRVAVSSFTQSDPSNDP